MDIADICYPFLVGPLSLEVLIQYIGKHIYLLLPLVQWPWPAYLCQQAILAHQAQYSFAIHYQVVFPPQPYPHPPVAVGLVCVLLADLY